MAIGGTFRTMNNRHTIHSPKNILVSIKYHSHYFTVFENI